MLVSVYFRSKLGKNLLEGTSQSTILQYGMLIKRDKVFLHCEVKTPESRHYYCVHVTNVTLSTQLQPKASIIRAEEPYD